MSVGRTAAEHPVSCSVSFSRMLVLFAGAFTGPTFATLQILTGGAVLLHRRHTVTNMIRDVGLRRTHHARFHRFFSQASWDLWELWRRLVQDGGMSQDVLRFGEFQWESSARRLHGKRTATDRP